MNGKKAKLIRRWFKEQDQWKKEPEYVIERKVKKIAHVTNSDGKTEMKKIDRIMLVNKNKVEYRRAKRAYKNGEYAIV